MKYTKYPELKNELKELAKEIKEWKRNRKEDKRLELKLELYQVQNQLYWFKRDFRHKHIAYCVLRGKKYEQIENYCRQSPNFDIIDSIMEKYGTEAVRVSA